VARIHGETHVSLGELHEQQIAERKKFRRGKWLNNKNSKEESSEGVRDRQRDGKKIKKTTRGLIWACQ